MKFLKEIIKNTIKGILSFFLGLFIIIIFFCIVLLIMFILTCLIAYFSYCVHLWLRTAYRSYFLLLTYAFLLLTSYFCLLRLLTSDVSSCLRLLRLLFLTSCILPLTCYSLLLTVRTCYVSLFLLLAVLTSYISYLRLLTP